MACQTVKPGSLTAESVKEETRDLAITPDTGWGAGSGSCPASKQITVAHQQFELPFTFLCDFAVAIRPILIGMAYLAAAMTFFGMSRRG